MSGKGPSVGGVPLTKLPRAAARKYLYRRIEMRRYGGNCGDSLEPSRDHGLRIELLGPESYDVVFGTNPHMEESDPENFHRQDSTCIVAWDGRRIASSTWMTRGEVHVHELQRSIDVPATEHFSCRSYVDPDYRGRALLSHMIHAYSDVQGPSDRVWGFVFAWNTNSIRSLERLGWRHYGDDWTTYVLGRRTSGSRSFPPRPPTTLDR